MWNPLCAVLVLKLKQGTPYYAAISIIYTTGMTWTNLKAPFLSQRTVIVLICFCKKVSQHFNDHQKANQTFSKI